MEASIAAQESKYDDYVSLYAACKVEIKDLQVELSSAEADYLTTNNEYRNCLRWVRNASRKLQAFVAKLKSCCKAGGDFDNDGHAAISCGGDDCDDQDATVYPGAPELCNDNIDNDCDGEVDETDLAVDAGGCTSSYYGYAPLEGTDLTANVSGGTAAYTYSWSSGETTQTISVNPSSTTTYTVSVTDASGCTATATVIVYVTDVRCGKKNDKISVCHAAGKSGKTNDLCISASAVKAHLKHGDQLGACGQTDPCASSGRTTQPVAERDLLHPGSVNVYPNPATNMLTLELLENVGQYDVILMDGQGRTVLSSTGSDRLMDVDISSLVNGMYYLVVQTAENLVVTKVTIAD